METTDLQTGHPLARPHLGALDAPAVRGAGDLLAPSHVWATLSVARQAEIRRAFLQVMQEVLRDVPEH